MKRLRSTRLGIASFDLTTCLGRGAEAHARALIEGASGLRCVEREGVRACLGLVEGVEALDGELAIFQSRAASILAPLVRSLTPALRARALDPRRIGVVIGTSTGGLDRTEEMLAGFALEPAFDLERQHAVAALAELARVIAGAEGPSAVVSTACTSGAKAFGVARRWFELGLVDAVVVGAADGICATTIRGFDSLQVLSDRPSRPFAEKSVGMNVAEGGAAFLVVREETDLVFRGYGESSDAHHVAHPEPSGAGAALAIRAALEDAELANVDYVNAHGTGTEGNDRAEARAISAVLGAAPLVASTKGATGHLLGAAGAVEAAFALLSLERGFVPPSLFSEPGAHLAGISVAHALKTRPISSVLSTSLAFGGSNTALVFARSELP